MKLVFLGAPGSGKGTQAARIAARYNIPHISTGEIFRENIHEMTPLGKLAKSYIDIGQLVPDEVTIEIVKDRLKREDCERGFILDGFPRDIAQAEALDLFAEPDLVIDLDIETEKLVRRLTGRRSCGKCGATYHVDFLGGRENCLNCGEKLIVREDDNVETVSKRMKVYKDSTEPLIKYYSAKGKLTSVDGDKAIDEVYNGITDILDRL